jgi:Holliday junction resolvase
LFASLLREHGYEAKRGVQYQGSPDSPDVIGLPGIHIEVKFTDKLRLYSAMAQSERDAGKDEMPIVAHKRSRDEWLVTMQFDEWIKLYKAYEKEIRNEND